MARHLARRHRAPVSYAALVEQARVRLLGRTVLVPVARGRVVEGTVAMKMDRGVVAGISDDGVVRVVVPGPETRYLGVTWALDNVAVLF